MVVLCLLSFVSRNHYLENDKNQSAFFAGSSPCIQNEKHHTSYDESSCVRCVVCICVRACVVLCLRYNSMGEYETGYSGTLTHWSDDVGRTTLHFVRSTQHICLHWLNLYKINGSHTHTCIMHTFELAERRRNSSNEYVVRFVFNFYWAYARERGFFHVERLR